MKLLFFTSSLRSGGAERVISRLANYWAEQGHQVSIVTLWDVSHDFYALHPAIQRHAINKHGSRKTVLGALWRDVGAVMALRRLMRLASPDVVVSFTGKNNLLAVLATIGLSARLVISERNNLATQNLSPAMLVCQRILYPLADKLVSVSRGVDHDFKWFDPEKRAVIYNPLDAVTPVSYDVAGKGAFTFLAVGSLTFQKNHAILIESFSRLANDFPDWNLVIAGEGGLRAELEAQIKTLGLTDRIRLLGNIKNVPDVMAACDVFVLPSRYEGFPNVLIEAMACGMAAISFDCPHGPSEIIRNGENGLLAPAEDSAKLEAAMRDLAANKDKRQDLGVNAKDITRALDIAVIAGQWRVVFGL